MDCVDENAGPIGSLEWIAGMEAILAFGLARLQAPQQPSSFEAASQAAVRQLVEIERELGKGPTACTVVVANAKHLRQVYHDQLILLGRLSDRLVSGADDDEFYVWLGALGAQGKETQPQKSVPAERPTFGAGPPRQDLPTASSTILSSDEADRPPGLPEYSPLRASAHDELREAAEIMAKIDSARREQTEVDGWAGMQNSVLEASIDEIENVGTASSPAGTAPLHAGNKGSAAKTFALVACEPESSALSESAILTPLAKTSQSGGRLGEPAPSTEPKKHTKPAGIEAVLLGKMARISELIELESAWSVASPQARDEFSARLMMQALDPE